MRLNPSTQTISNAFILTDLKSYGATTAPSHCTIYYYKYYNYYVIIIIIIINIIIIIIIWKGYFKVNSILIL